MLVAAQGCGRRGPTVSSGILVGRVGQPLARSSRSPRAGAAGGSVTRTYPHGHCSGMAPRSGERAGGPSARCERDAAGVRRRQHAGASRPRSVNRVALEQPHAPPERRRHARPGARGRAAQESGRKLRRDRWATLTSARAASASRASAATRRSGRSTIPGCSPPEVRRWAKDSPVSRAPIHAVETSVSLTHEVRSARRSS